MATLNEDARDWGPSRMAPIWATEMSVRRLVTGIADGARAFYRDINLDLDRWLCDACIRGDHARCTWPDCECDCREEPNE